MRNAMATGRYGSRHEASLKVRRRYSHLANAAPPSADAVPGLTSFTGRDAERELDALALRLQGEERISYARAYSAVLRQNPALCRNSRRAA